MSRSASRLDDDGSPLGDLAHAVLIALGGAIGRNPGAVAGITAFVVALSFISANALWNQQQAHTTTFFVTREPMAAPAPTFADEPEAEEPAVEEVLPAAQQRRGDPMVERVQSMLIDLQLYSGTVDGLVGPQTRKAVEDYQKLAGLDVSGEISEDLLRDLATQAPTRTDAVAPAPRPAPSTPASTEAAAPSSEDVARIQAGLRAFGHDGIEIDGVVGMKTKSAIREFQSLFGLPVTGEPDLALSEKMREIGLTN